MFSLFYLTGVSEFVPGRESISRHCRPPGIADPDGDQDPHWPGEQKRSSGQRDF